MPLKRIPAMSALCLVLPGFRARHGTVHQHKHRKKGESGPKTTRNNPDQNRGPENGNQHKYRKEHSKDFHSLEMGIFPIISRQHHAKHVRQFAATQSVETFDFRPRKVGQFFALCVRFARASLRNRHHSAMTSQRAMICVTQCRSPYTNRHWKERGHQMAYRLKYGHVGKAESLLFGALGCFDTIDDDGFDHARDETLHERSAYELVRAQLTDAQRAELDTIDAFWRGHADDFNAAFAALHQNANLNLVLADWVVDSDGHPATVPPSHWWWRPIG